MSNLRLQDQIQGYEAKSEAVRLNLRPGNNENLLVTGFLIASQLNVMFSSRRLEVGELNSSQKHTLEIIIFL